MRIEVQVKPNSRRESVEKLPDGTYKVSLNAPPTEGRANERLIEVLALFFKVPKSAVTIVRGRTGKVEGLLGKIWKSPRRD